MLTAHSLCWLCQLPLAVAHWGLCSRCSASLAITQPLCPQCGLPAQYRHQSCGRCLQHPPPWQSLITLNDYIAPLNTLVHQLKFNGKPELATALARLLLLQYKARSDIVRPNRLVSVPLWRYRHWRRGYNQSDLLCRPLARWLGCEWSPQTLRRLRATTPQHQLSARLRKHNLKNSFQLDIPVAGLHIAIVDDVVTTGSTVAELSRLLLRSGAASVQVWCLCRTL